MSVTTQSSLVQGGFVHLVGAGPGDPELLTVKAARVIAHAQVVVYDQLVGAGVLELLPRHAHRIYAGKQQGCHALPQSEINRLLVALARRGRRVVRLKGGDPYVFGRGGEEAEHLARHGIPFEVVPGVTSASGAAASIGVPLTHRGLARAVVFATGHLQDGSLDLDWTALARPGQTVVIYMGITRVADICEQLVAHGLPPRTPAATVERATTAAERVVTATVGTLAAEAAAAGVRPPALIVVGEVVALRAVLAPPVDAASHQATRPMRAAAG
jgi:uroporphyrin-III C-methyltransferase